jgi:polysaccharide biosynthesis protein PslA
MLSTAENAGMADASGINRLVSQRIDSKADQFPAYSFTQYLQFAWKRLIDIVVSFTALLILLPLLVIIMIVIRYESKGSPIFTQFRWGRNKTKFKVIKFRSMRSDLCDPTGVAQTVAGDPRTTRVGAFLRRTNLDELRHAGRRRSLRISRSQLS